MLADDWKRRVGEVTHSISNIYTLTEEDCHKLLQVSFGRSDLLLSGKVSYNEVRAAIPGHVLKRYKSIAKSSVLEVKPPQEWI